MLGSGLVALHGGIFIRSLYRGSGCFRVLGLFTFRGNECAVPRGWASHFSFLPFFFFSFLGFFSFLDFFSFLCFARMASASSTLPMAGASFALV